MIENEGIIRRLMLFFKVKKKTDLANKLGIDVSTLSSWIRRSSLNYDTILAKVKGIDLHWLFTGKGDMMYYTRHTNTIKDEIEVENFISTKAFAQGKNNPVVLIPQKVYAGYLSGFSEDTHDELPIIHFMNYKDGNRYRFFEISGDSMETLIQSGDYVLSERISHLKEIKEGAIYIVCTADGLVCKRIEIDKKNIILHSENKNYSTKVIPKEDVKELWKVIWVHKKVK